MSPTTANLPPCTRGRRQPSAGLMIPYRHATQRPLPLLQSRGNRCYFRPGRGSVDPGWSTRLSQGHGERRHLGYALLTGERL